MEEKTSNREIQWLTNNSKVWSTSSLTFWVFIFSKTNSVMIESTRRFNFWTVFSPYSARDSAVLSLSISTLICFLYFSSLCWAFSSATSRAFKFSPITLSSSSRSTILDSPPSALSSALSRSPSTMASFLATSSYLMSLSSTICFASFSWFSEMSILCSSIMFFVSRVFKALSMESFRELLGRDGALRLRPLQFILKQRNLPLESLDLSLSEGVSLQLLVKLGCSLGQLFQGDVQLVLHVLHLLLKIADRLFCLLGQTGGSPELSVQLIGPGHGILSLSLQRLHLLLNRVHLLSW